ncbi:hypothetical protein A1O1_02454 [Capronia coronata CBS 617.96]|uniref:N-acetyltransferase domain-containing protein n=1 Tax=Capronia coronata CBS 617.96 TaxID=1182541 RepID=W9YXR4_9EURO|nr:uncharacterized protein A1O1_02454 [Capronia coronata CBS 617.96]EXJ94061.1 hypothetical protein A1O1_02454 [Capronia coronata CBS 617.96]
MPAFDPKAYGWPTTKAKPTGTSGDHRLASNPQISSSHPTWTLNPPRQPRYQTTLRSGSSTESEVNKQTIPAHSALSSSHVSNEPGNLVSTSHDKTMPDMSTTSQVSTGATTQCTSKGTGFNPYAYGHPGASYSSQKHTQVRSSSHPPDPAKSRTIPTNDTIMASKGSLKDAKLGSIRPAYPRDISHQSVTKHEPSPPFPTQTRAHGLKGDGMNGQEAHSARRLSGSHASGKQKQFEPKVGSSQIDNLGSGLQSGRAMVTGARAIGKGGETKPRPATYDTLKREGETPEQVIARLQSDATRAIGLRLRRQAKGEPIITGLVALDFLRQPLPPTGLDQVEPFPTALEAGLGQDHISDHRQSQHRGVALGAVQATNNLQARSDARAALHRPNGDSVVTSKAHAEKAADEAILAMASDRGWAIATELKPPIVKPDSNVEESGGPSSDVDSLQPMGGDFGRLIHSQEPPIEESSLRGWDGNMQPPPVEWELRPRFHNNTSAYISGFDAWLRDIAVRTMRNVAASLKPDKAQESPHLGFGILPTEAVCNLDNHADGISFVRKDSLIDPADKEHFPRRLPGEVLLDPIEPADFEAEAKLDLKDQMNRNFKEETAQMFVDKRMMYLARSKMEAEARQPIPVQQEPEPEPEPEQEQEQEQEVELEQKHDLPAEEPEPPQPVPKVAPVKSNVYLRPAVTSDFAGMTRIYNWNVSNSVRTSELAEIDEQDMAARHETSISARLPIIVAVERNRKNARRKPPRRRVNPNHPIQNIDPNYSAVVKDENVVGWASATDWSATDYVEAITAELEVYVAHDFRKRGIGRCLMDALLDATDRGYMRQGGYSFHVAPEIQHLYTGGGGRDLHKIIFQVRSYNHPYTPAQVYRMEHAGRVLRNWHRGDDSEDGHGNPNQSVPSSTREKDFSKEARLNDREDDYSVWLKEWLESFGFEEEAWLKKIGTKNKRFVDVRYLTRETRWQPTDRQLPDFSRGI